MARQRFINNYKIQVTCSCCGKEYLIPCNKQDFEDFVSGEKLIQEAFPYMPAEYRELFISQLCPTCWDKIFPDEEV